VGLFLFGNNGTRKRSGLDHMDEHVILTEGLSKTYGALFWKKKEPSLVDLNLRIPKGSVFGFLGPNGAGKTTTIRLLMDLIKPTQGRALVLGKPVNDIQIKHEIGFLQDSPAFSSYLTAYEFLNICAKLLRIPSGERKKRIYGVLESVGMQEHAKSKLGGFSRGMTQRIGIAQAIMNNPRLLILDEPLVGLDPMGRQELKNIIAEQKRNGTDVFFCSHILSDVEKICDRVGILYKGRLLCFGTLDELLADTGVRLTVRPGNEPLVKEVLPHASSSNKREDGTVEMTFEENEEILRKARRFQEENPSQIQIRASKESLEDFFFRTIDKHRSA
jgi:ABC-2 type transport system ATP-binding protein